MSGPHSRGFSKLRYCTPELPPLMKNSKVSSKSSTSPWRQTRNEFAGIGSFSVVCPMIAPSSTRQSLGLPSQPFRETPSKMGTNLLAGLAAHRSDVHIAASRKRFLMDRDMGIRVSLQKLLGYVHYVFSQNRKGQWKFALIVFASQRSS